jgi:hypothetical protein
MSMDQKHVDIKSQLDSKIKNFNEMLQKINSVSDKKKQLYIEIYTNAIIDRQNAYSMYCVLVEIAADKSTEHAVHGRTIATYIERMSKANDQLIKLSEILTNITEDDGDDDDGGDIYDRIKNKAS